MSKMAVWLLAAVLIWAPVPEGVAQEDEGEEPVAEEAGGSPITQDERAASLSGVGGGRQDPQAKLAAQNPPKSSNPVTLRGGGGSGGGGGGAPFAGNFRIIDLDAVKSLGGHKELPLPPGAAWAIRFKARKVGNARGFSFGLEPRTGSDGLIRARSAVSSKPGVLNPGKSCESYVPIRRETVQQHPSVKTFIGDAPKGGCALQQGAFYYFNVYSDGGCQHPEAITRGCPVLFSISNGGMTFLAPGYKD
jgi:hypothetical protein